MDPLVFIVNTVEQVGLQEAEEKDAVAPEGNPEILKETPCEAPDTKRAVIVSVTEPPTLSDCSPEFESA